MQARMNVRYPLLALVAGVLGAAPFPVAAQTVGLSTPATRSRFAFAGDLIVSKPKGDLDNYIGYGFGPYLTGLFRVDRAGIFSLRADFGALQYGRERKKIPLLAGTGRVTVDLVTTNMIQSFGVGGQLAVPGARVRPYVNGGVGLTRFLTSSVLRDRSSDEEFGSTENASDFTTSWIFGGGVYVPLGARSPVSINLGGRYYFGGEATYLQEGGIRDNPDGTVTLSPVRSKTDFVVWQLGVSMALPNKRGS